MRLDVMPLHMSSLWLEVDLNNYNSKFARIKENFTINALINDHLDPLKFGAVDI